MNKHGRSTKAGFWFIGVALAWATTADAAGPTLTNVPIVQWPAPLTWQPPKPTTSSAGATEGRTSLATLTPGLPFFAVTPCRVVDTRVGMGFSGFYGPPALVAAVARNFPIPGQCGIPTTAQAVSFNFTVLNEAGPGFLVVWQQGGTYTGISTLNYSPGQIVANAAVVALGTTAGNEGGLSVAAGVYGTDLIIDINGYYAPAGNWTSVPGTTSTTDNVTIGGNLTVGGSITGNPINAKYQDVAEWVPGRGSLRPGTVVVIDETTVNGVVPSRTEYDTRVAGVVSESPGVILGEGGDGKAKIATTGRVRVRVIATEPIRVGDLLVTSSTPGVAMKSIPIRVGDSALHRTGTLIGKALESLPAGEGEILVLLSLQ